MTIENKQISSAQQGFVTVLIVLLVGLAVAASALGTAYYINMSQKSLVSSHALTNAQSGAWTGVEILRQYLEILAKDGSISSLNEESFLSLNVQGKTCNLQKEEVCPLQVKIISSKEVGTDSRQFRVTANIQNISKKSEASSTIQAVYYVVLGSTATSNQNDKTINSNSAFDIYTNTTLTGGDVKILTDSTNPATINIYGNLTANSTNLNIDTLNVDGDVTFTGGSKNVREVYANGKVKITGPGSELISLISADSIETTGGGNFGEFYADNSINAAYRSLKSAYSKNGDITLSGGTVELASSGGKIILKNGSIGTATAKNDIDLDGITHIGILKTLSNINMLSNALQTLKQASANKNISMSIINNLNAERIVSAGDLTCGKGWVVPYLQAKSINGDCSSFGMENPSITNPVSESEITIKGKQKQITAPTAPTVLATDYESLANFIFEEEKINGVIYKKVTIQNLEKANDVDINGQYYLMQGNYIQDPITKKYVSNSSYQGTGYLCPVAKWTSSSCTGGIQNLSRIYPGWSDVRISTSWDGAWQLSNNNEAAVLSKINGVYNSLQSNLNYPAMAPSVMLFKGNLKFSQGIYIGAFLATGNIETANSSSVIYSPYYAGAQYVCDVYETAKNQSGGLADTTKGKYRMPINLCTNKTTLNTSNNFLGNIALLAGSKDGSGNYIGGEIKTAQAPIYGNIIAGSKLSSNGTTYIRGGVSVLNLGGARESTMSATVQIDLTKKKDSESDTFQPGSVGNPGIGQASPIAKLKWARYI
ncbi:hypothetical protein [Psychrobacter aquimaris]|uniref:hypothetical protein n=3 Tax=Psychrobacter aquimaris TaxID=292733 RepID=UPI0018E01D5E|nr:hypothetical protein [Psychrobacter aquimaris]